jgi:hypothetical protein
MTIRTTCLSFLLSVVAFAAMANMAAPWRKGTNSARPFTNQWIDILREDLTIKPGRHFRTAAYDINYHISAKKDGIRIPLLFIALDQSSDFLIEVDGKPVGLQGVPGEYTTDHPGFRDFRYFFEEERSGNDDRVVVRDSPNGGKIYSLNALKYFTANLSKGEHDIHISYTAYRWQDLSDNWIKTYEFRYALSPANYWKSFGKFYLTIDASECSHPLELRLNKRTKVQPGTIVKHTFEGIPSEVLCLSYKPEIHGFPAVLLAIGPLGIALIIGIPLAIAHFLWVAARNRRRPEANNGWIIGIGGLFVPFVFFWTWINAYDWIDAALGPHSAGYHGYYSIGIIALSLLLVPIYFLAIYFENRAFRPK